MMAHFLQENLNKDNYGVTDKTEMVLYGWRSAIGNTFISFLSPTSTLSPKYGQPIYSLCL